MTIQIQQTISNRLTENRTLIDTRTFEAYIILPDEGKKLKNIKTARVYDGYVSVNNKDDIKNYVEIDA